MSNIYIDITEQLKIQNKDKTHQKISTTLLFKMDSEDNDNALATREQASLVRKYYDKTSNNLAEMTLQ